MNKPLEKRKKNGMKKPLRCLILWRESSLMAIVGLYNVKKRLAGEQEKNGIKLKKLLRKIKK